jgi:hypothetical protein
MNSHRRFRRPAMPRRAAALAFGALLCMFSSTVQHSAQASTMSGEMQVSLAIRDICTMDTDSPQPRIACSAGAPFRLFKDSFFAASPAPSEPEVFATSFAMNENSVEIAF